MGSLSRLLANIANRVIAPAASKIMAATHDMANFDRVFIAYQNQRVG
jgi:hypothetical protein